MSDEPTPSSTECRYTPPVSGDLSDRRQYTLAYFWLSGYFSLTASYVYLLASGTAAESIAAMREVLTLLTPVTLMVLGYFYTSSIGGRRKDEALANAAVTK